MNAFGDGLLNNPTQITFLPIHNHNRSHPMKELKLITKRIKLDFNADDVSENNIDLESIRESLEDGYKLNGSPVLIKHIDGHLLVSFAVTQEGPKVGFGF
jgi:hypothetical protein